VSKVRTTLTIDEEVLRAVKVRGARTGKGDSEVIEEALRRELGFDLLERLWQRDDMGEEQALALAVEAQHKTRRRRRGVRAVRDPHKLIAALLSPSAGSY
jgi:metal-responsive CopG/Arc/MetJ family transcriptional regulator